MITAPPAPDDPAGEARIPNPWWIPRFLFGRIPPGIETSHLKILGAVVLALLFEEYDLAMITAALPYIAADLAIVETDLGFYLSLVRFGALPALLVIPLGDRIGRRRTFLLSIAGSSIATFATGLATTPEIFVACQMLARTFIVTGSAMAYVIVAEELPADRRGWGLGMLAALAAAGFGITFAIFSRIDDLPGGWRTLYFLGVTALLLFPFFRRRISETRHFTDHQGSGAPVLGGLAAIFGPLVSLFRRYPLQLTGLFVATSAIGFAGGSAFQFTSYYTIEVLGWKPWHYSVMTIGAGTLGVIGNLVAGRLADRFGRRLVGFTMLATYPAFVLLYYNSSGWLVALAFSGFVFTSSGGRMMVRAFSAELFATAERGTSTGTTIAIENSSAGLGLLALFFVSSAPGDLLEAVPLLAVAILVAAFVLLFFRETRGTDLANVS